MSAASEKRLARYLKAKAREEAAANHPGRPIAATGVISWLWRGGRMPWPKPVEDVCAVVGLVREYQSTLDPELWAAHVGVWPAGA
jgi:hypothetical protein